MKNEAKKIDQCLWHIIDLFDDIVIVDTWSTDDTIAVLKKYWVEAIPYGIPHKDKHRLIDARNFSIEKNTCEWVLILDWDETISREDLIKIKNHTPIADASGYFIKWTDNRYEVPFEDYKLCLINKNKIRFLFSVHACPQVYARDNEWYALWMHGVTLQHYPEFKNYRSNYIVQILEGITENPGCLRFYRFLWYTYFKHERYDDALKALEFVTAHIGNRFPVETLNTIMILATIYQQKWDTIQSYYYIQMWLDYYQKVHEDFEVKVNFRVADRFNSHHKKLLDNPQAEIVPYEFAY